MSDQEVVSQIWLHVVRVVNKLVETHDTYGFGKFSEQMNPRLDVVVKAFNVADALLKTLTESGQLDPDEYRQAIDSRQCIYHTKRLSLALESDDEDEYKRLIDLLTKQATI
ncbi:hypothetical protein [Pseudoxanthomonas sp.]|uniref:hypothetical protein n=1 Tax=Pseudoxanthomonas sp. TaxID=1871049 RepID=UPI0026116982|nr:hypothetical protein [Pseudoxanthomonas sp.]WDS36206.1 MAG: hypothetical protein O8I58_18375 [Pseudoxanthomonas sp.]